MGLPVVDDVVFAHLAYLLAHRLWPQRAGLDGQAALELVSALLWILLTISVMFDVMLAFWGLLGMHGVVLAALLGAAIALAWALPAGMAGGEAYRNAIFWGQTADRMVESFAHRRPFWWYVLLLPVFIAFSFISGKQPHYLVPMFPAFSLLLSRVLADHPAFGVGLPAMLSALFGTGLILAASGQIAALHGQVAALPPVWPGALLVLLALAVFMAGRRGVKPVVNLAVLGAGMMGLLQLALMSSIEPLYDIKPMAQAIKQVQDTGRPVANVATYHAQYQFLGRLEAPLIQLRGPDVAPWLSAHPVGYAVIYLKDTQGMAEVVARHEQAYRGGAVVLVEGKRRPGYWPPMWNSANQASGSRCGSGTSRDGEMVEMACLKIIWAA